MEVIALRDGPVMSPPSAELRLNAKSLPQVENTVSRIYLLPEATLHLVVISKHFVSLSDQGWRETLVQAFSYTWGNGAQKEKGRSCHHPRNLWQD